MQGIQLSNASTEQILALQSGKHREDWVIVDKIVPDNPLLFARTILISIISMWIQNTEADGKR